MISIINWPACLLLMVLISCSRGEGQQDIRMLDPLRFNASLFDFEVVPWEYDTGFNKTCKAMPRLTYMNIEENRSLLKQDESMIQCEWVISYNAQSSHFMVCKNSRRVVFRPDLVDRNISAMSIVAAQTEPNCVYRPTLLQSPSVSKANGKSQGQGQGQGQVQGQGQGQDQGQGQGQDSISDPEECDYVEEEEITAKRVQPVWMTADHPVVDLNPMGDGCNVSNTTFRVTELLTDWPRGTHKSLPPVNTWSYQYLMKSNCGALSGEGKASVNNRNPFKLTLASSHFYVLSQKVMNQNFTQSDVTALLKYFTTSLQKSIALARTDTEVMKFVNRLTTTCQTTLLRQFVIPDACNKTNAIAFQIKPSMLIPGSTTLKKLMIPQFRLFNSTEGHPCEKMSVDITPAIEDPNQLCIGIKPPPIDDLFNMSVEDVLPYGQFLIAPLNINRKLENNDARVLMLVPYGYRLYSQRIFFGLQNSGDNLFQVF